MFLRYLIKQYFNTLYTVMLDIGISIEILFGESISMFCSDYLNIDIFFRVLDIAFIQAY